MIINVHTHIWRGQDVNEWFESQQLERADVNIVFPGGDPEANGKCLEAARAFPGRVIPFGVLCFDRVSPELVDEYHAMGFKGLKMIGTHLPYDSPDYYPVYEKAVEYGMPVFFHTGHLSLEMGIQRRNFITRDKMDAVRLDGIARAFPELYLMGAHLGNPLWEDACSIAFKHQKVYFDLSGETAHRLTLARWRSLLMTAADENLRTGEEKLNLALAGKFLFGTDGPPVPYVLEFYENLFREFGFPEETRESVLWRIAARILGLEESLPINK